MDERRRGPREALSQHLAGRMATALFVGGGIGTLASAFLSTAASVNRAGVISVGLTAVGVGIAAWYVPLQRWSERATLSLVPIAFALIALANHFAGAEPFRYGIFFVVSVAWIGYAHRPGTSVVFSPLLVLAYLLPPHADRIGHGETGVASSWCAARSMTVGTSPFRQPRSPFRPHNGTAIPAANLVITSAHPPSRVSGQEISSTGVHARPT